MNVILRYGIQSRKYISSYCLPWLYMKIKKRRYCFLGNSFNRLHSNKTSSFGASLQSDQNLFFSFRFMSSLAGTFPADRGVVKFNQFLLAIDAVTESHGRRNVFQYPASAQPGCSNIFGKLQGGDISLVSSCQVKLSS